MYAYALSLLTQRQLIINITEPCNFSKIFSPNKVNWLPSQHDFSNRKYINISCFKNETRGVCAYENMKKIEEDLIYFSGTDHGSDIFFGNHEQNGLLDLAVQITGQTFSMALKVIGKIAY